MTKYDQIIETVFFKNFQEGDIRVSFNRNELAEACDELRIKRIKNLGDIPYSYRFRKELPSTVKEKAPTDSEWIILGLALLNMNLDKLHQLK